MADVGKFIADDLFPAFLREREHLTVLDDWYRGEQERPWVPRTHSKEFDTLRARAISPWLNLVVTTLAQTLYVEGYRRDRERENATAWSAWQANGFDSRQIAVHRGALALGHSFVTVLPGGHPDRPEPMPVVRGVSARRMIAYYGEDSDLWPMYAFECIPQGKKWLARYYDEGVVRFFEIDQSGQVKPIETREHGMGVVPVVRFTNELDLDGRTIGEVEPLIPVAARIDQGVMDRLVVQKFGSWKVRYATGMAEPETESEKSQAKIQLGQDDILVGTNPDMKFGTLDETPLSGYIEARDSDLRDLAAISQTPPNYLLGQMVNLSAEALAAAEAALTRKSEERKHSFGESHEQWLRLAAGLMGDSEGAQDMASQVVWRDVESRSMAQVADALGKLAQTLGYPVELLWERIPGVTQTDIEEAKRIRESQDSLAALTETLDRQSRDAPQREAPSGGPVA